MGNIEPATMLKDLIELAGILRCHVIALLAEERQTGLMNVDLSHAMNVYGKVLVSIHRLELDLGMRKENCKLP
jgi:hypothetical protein